MGRGWAKGRTRRAENGENADEVLKKGPWYYVRAAI